MEIDERGDSLGTQGLDGAHDVKGIMLGCRGQNDADLTHEGALM